MIPVMQDEIRIKYRFLAILTKCNEETEINFLNGEKLKISKLFLLYFLFEFHC